MKRSKQSVETPRIVAHTKETQLVWWHYLLTIAGLAIIAFVVYGPALSGEFVFDDIYLPFLDPALQNQPFRAWASVRPILMYTYWMNYQSSGTEPYPYHVFNLMLHILNSMLICAIVRRVLAWVNVTGTRNLVLAAASGLLFLLHPVQTESVAYVASRSETLSVLFFLAAYSIFVYGRTRGVSVVEVLLILLFFGAAVLTKEHTVVLPGLMLLTDFFFPMEDSRWQSIRRNWKIYVPIAGFGAVGVASAIYVLKNSPSAGFGIKDIRWYEYLFTQFRSIWHYIRLYIFPAGQSADYDFPLSKTIVDGGAIVFLLLLLAASYFAWRKRDEYPLAGLGWFGFLILLAPTSSFIPILDVLAERRVYLPFLCLIFITLDVIRRWRATPGAMGTAAGIVLVVLGALAYARNEVWGSNLALWEDTVQKSPNNSRAHFQLGFAYYQSGKCLPAIKEFESTARLSKPDDRLLIDWALALDCAREPEKALAKLRQAAMISQRAQIYSTMGMIYGKHGQNEEALRVLDIAEKNDPRFDMTYFYRGNVLLASGQKEKAAAEYQRALAINPQNTFAADALRQAQR